MDPSGETEAQAGVMATRPATAPVAAPSTVGLPRWMRSIPTQPRTAIAVAVFVLLWLVLLFARRLAVYRLGKLEADNEHVLALDVAVDVVRATQGWFFFLIAVLVGSRFLELAESISLWIVRAAMIATLLQLGLWLSAGVVKSIRIQNGEPVEFGQVLFVIDQRAG